MRPAATGAEVTAFRVVRGRDLADQAGSGGNGGYGRTRPADYDGEDERDERGYLTEAAHEAKRTRQRRATLFAARDAFDDGAEAALNGLHRGIAVRCFPSMRKQWLAGYDYVTEAKSGRRAPTFEELFRATGHPADGLARDGSQDGSGRRRVRVTYRMPVDDNGED